MLSEHERGQIINLDTATEPHTVVSPRFESHHKLHFQSKLHCTKTLLLRVSVLLSLLVSILERVIYLTS